MNNEETSIREKLHDIQLNEEFKLQAWENMKKFYGGGVKNAAKTIKGIVVDDSIDHWKKNETVKKAIAGGKAAGQSVKKGAENLYNYGKLNPNLGDKGIKIASDLYDKASKHKTAIGVSTAAGLGALLLAKKLRAKKKKSEKDKKAKA